MVKNWTQKYRLFLQISQVCNVIRFPNGLAQIITLSDLSNILERRWNDVFLMTEFLSMHISKPCLWGHYKIHVSIQQEFYAIAHFNLSVSHGTNK